MHACRLAYRRSRWRCTGQARISPYRQPQLPLRMNGHPRRGVVEVSAQYIISIELPGFRRPRTQAISPACDPAGDVRARPEPAYIGNRSCIREWEGFSATHGDKIHRDTACRCSQKPFGIEASPANMMVSASMAIIMTSMHRWGISQLQLRAL